MTPGAKILLITVLAGCGTGDSAVRWTGTVDTLPSGQIVVSNDAAAVWQPEEEWVVTEVARIGSADSDGPDMFGNLTAFALDGSERIWLLDDHAQEVRIFTTAGDHVRTIGRKGGGPGEFSRAVRIDFDPAGRAWIMDPQNNRLSVFDTAGNYLHGKAAGGGFIILPWPGGFDDQWRYYIPAPRFEPGRFSFALARHDTAFTPLDTLEVPRDPRPKKQFTLTTAGGSMTAGLPFQGGVTWHISRRGTVWALVTDQYRLFELTSRGDTVRTITRAFSPVPVTTADRAQAREDLKWFTSQGGKADWSQLPSTKPIADDFFEDDEGNLWVHVLSESRVDGTTVDVFDRDGRYLGAVKLPFPIETNPVPQVRSNRLYAVTRDSLDVPALIIATIKKGKADRTR